MSFYWSEYVGEGEEGTVARWKRWEQNIGRFLGDITEREERMGRRLEDIANVLAAKTDGKLVEAIGGITDRLDSMFFLLEKFSPTDKGNIMERAYMLAVMQERQEMQENLKELMLGLGTIGEVQEFMAQRPELRKFYERVVEADKLPQEKP